MEILVSDFALEHRRAEYIKSLVKPGQYVRVTVIPEFGVEYPVWGEVPEALVYTGWYRGHPIIGDKIKRDSPVYDTSSISVESVESGVMWSGGNGLTAAGFQDATPAVVIIPTNRIKTITAYPEVGNLRTYFSRYAIGDMGEIVCTQCDGGRELGSVGPVSTLDVILSVIDEHETEEHEGVTITELV